MKEAKSLFLEKYKAMGIPVPRWHFVLGSLLGSVLNQIGQKVSPSEKQSSFPKWEERGRLSFSEIPGLKSPSAPSHVGSYVYFYNQQKNTSICFQCGRLHGYEGLTAGEVVKTVMGPRFAGTKNFVLSNISGSLKKDLRPGEVVAMQDHINLTGQSPLTGLTHKKDFYFLDMDKAYHKPTTHLIVAEMQKQNLKVRSGVYVGVLGPQFETPAEVALFAKWGGDVVGMSTIWELIALHYSKALVSGFSVVTNMATGLGESVEIIQKRLKPCFIKVLQSFFNFADKQ